MDRTTIINELIYRLGYTEYLEIGIYVPERNFDRISCAYKHGVDPAYHGCDPESTHIRVDTPECEALVTRSTSDFFFDNSPAKFDLIFVDGLHPADQTRADLLNALRHLKKGGCIVMHDCNPATPEAALPEKPNNGRRLTRLIVPPNMNLRSPKEISADGYQPGSRCGCKSPANAYMRSSTISPSCKTCSRPTIWPS